MREGLRKLASVATLRRLGAVAFIVETACVPSQPGDCHRVSKDAPWSDVAAQVCNTNRPTPEQTQAVIAAAERYAREFGNVTYSLRNMRSPATASHSGRFMPTEICILPQEDIPSLCAPEETPVAQPIPTPVPIPVTPIPARPVQAPDAGPAPTDAAGLAAEAGIPEAGIPDVGIGTSETGVPDAAPNTSVRTGPSAAQLRGRLVTELANADMTINRFRSLPARHPAREALQPLQTAREAADRARNNSSATAESLANSLQALTRAKRRADAALAEAVQ